MKKELFLLMLLFCVFISFIYSSDQYDAEFISARIPGEMIAGQSYQIVVTYKNTGIQSWTRDGMVRLGSDNPQNNMVWGVGRVYLAANERIEPGQRKVFRFKVTAPAAPGKYTCQWSMLKEGCMWFGEPSIWTRVNVLPRLEYNSEFVSHTIPDSMISGDKRQISVTFKNIGTKPWDTKDLVKLGSDNPQNNLIWGIGRVEVPSGVTVPTGGKITFNFKITAPAVAGKYRCQWRMLKEFYMWFGESSAGPLVDVQPRPDYDAQFDSHSIPGSMITGETQRINVTFINTGAKPWTNSDQVKLGSDNPQNNSIWGTSRMEIPAGVTVPLGGKITFTFDITAPDIPGEYNCQWRMLKEYHAWFGQASINCRITVNQGIRVEIVSPAPGETLSGSVPLTIGITGNAAEKIDFYLDGVLYDSVKNPQDNPYIFNWDTWRNHLPIPNHEIDYEYYGVVGWLLNPNPHRFDCTSEVNGYTNSFTVSRSPYKEIPDQLWMGYMGVDLQNAIAQNRHISLDLCLNVASYKNDISHLWKVLDVVSPYWRHIRRIEVLHEPSPEEYNREEICAVLERVVQELAARGLEKRPLGITLAPPYSDNFKQECLALPCLDWLGIEAYIDGPGHENSQIDIAHLNDTLEIMKKVPPDKEIVLIMMAYNRNGTYTNMDSLRDLQIPTYLKAYNNNQVTGIRMFSYNRAGGTRENPVLKTPHELIGEKILGKGLPPPVGPAVNGIRTILVKVYDVNGNSSQAQLIVNIAN